MNHDYVQLWRYSNEEAIAKSQDAWDFKPPVMLASLIWLTGIAMGVTALIGSPLPILPAAWLSWKIAAQGATVAAAQNLVRDLRNRPDLREVYRDQPQINSILNAPEFNCR